MVAEDFLVKKHLRLISRCLGVLPSAYVGFYNSRPTLLFFLLSSLDVLDRLDTALTEESKQDIIKFLYDLQIESNSGLPLDVSGFCGSLCHIENSKSEQSTDPDSYYDCAHIAQTYTALCCLLVLGDDLKQVDSRAILSGVSRCQKDDGSFCAFGFQNSENDMRFVYCAVAICFILNDYSFINTEKLKHFIRNSINYDGGIGQGPMYESHGGSTYCAIASLYMLGNLWDNSVITKKQIERLKNWALLKQDEGFHGRTNKPDDSCYAFWIGATLSMLNSQYLVDETKVRSFLIRTQDELIGGFSKYEDSTSDALHTYFSIAALSIFEEPLLNPIFPPLNISRRAYEHLMRIRPR
ncbi:prenyltransferase and squalene oxidase repeat domain-containing protein [Ditylenchus destructor]|uniref:Geranylgeranyl transferase type-1 subunit beta n=1 Tax=Ditylenchus destructor TaxID=166010 RepID=A0AAD4NE65_9BILA|nr:prenyltransferase and squalene oxidase repeat domain-containing protein [Ditylenchus destructor]